MSNDELLTTFERWWADAKNWEISFAEWQLKGLAEAAWDAGARAAHESRDLESEERD